MVSVTPWLHRNISCKIKLSINFKRHSVFQRSINVLKKWIKQNEINVLYMNKHDICKTFLIIFMFQMKNDHCVMSLIKDLNKLDKFTSMHITNKRVHLKITLNLSWNTSSCHNSRNQGLSEKAAGIPNIKENASRGAARNLSGGEGEEGQGRPLKC